MLDSVSRFRFLCLCDVGSEGIARAEGRGIQVYKMAAFVTKNSLKFTVTLLLRSQLKNVFATFTKYDHVTNDD